MSDLRGLGVLLRLNVRRDRWLLIIWTLTFALVAVASAEATVGLYPDESSRAQAAEVINATPALVAMYGRIADVTSLGAISMFKLTGMGTLMVGLFAVLIVIRHTRADEETGRAELVAAGAVGRYAQLTAGVLTAALGTVAIGSVTALALLTTELPASGSFAFGLTWIAAGLAFTGVGALVAQLPSGARAARGLGVLALAAAFLLRALGDTAGVEPGIATWLSPLGWAQQIQPYAGNRWALALPPIGLGALLVAIAGQLARRRDLGTGLLPTRAGPAVAGNWLRSPLALAWRLQRGAFFAWLAGFVLLALVAGQIISTVGQMLQTPSARAVVVALGGVGAVSEAFVSVELNFIAVFAAAYGISAALRLAGEENSRRGELVLTGSHSRSRWAAAFLTVALVSSAVLVLASGLVLGASHALQVDDGAVWAPDLVAALVRVPAVWVLVALTAALHGLSARAAPLAWGALAGTFLVSEVGPLLDLPDWVRNLSPFSHVPNLPGGELTVGPPIVLLLVSAALAGIAVAGFPRRDVAFA